MHRPWELLMQILVLVIHHSTNSTKHSSTHRLCLQMATRKQRASARLNHHRHHNDHHHHFHHERGVLLQRSVSQVSSRLTDDLPPVTVLFFYFDGNVTSLLHWNVLWQLKSVNWGEKKFCQQGTRVDVARVK